MFGVAKLVLQNKIVLIGLVAVGGFFFIGNKETSKPSSPWSSTPVAAAAPHTAKGSMTDKMMGVVSSASKYAGVDKVLPTDLAKKTTGNFDNAEKSYKAANHASD